MAIWNVRYVFVAAPSVPRGLYFYAADARTMRQKDLDAAVRNAAKRAKERLEKKGEKVRILELNCVG